MKCRIRATTFQSYLAQNVLIYNWMPILKGTIGASVPFRIGHNWIAKSAVITICKMFFFQCSRRAQGVRCVLWWSGALSAHRWRRRSVEALRVLHKLEHALYDQRRWFHCCRLRYSDARERLRRLVEDWVCGEALPLFILSFFKKRIFRSRNFCLPSDDVRFMCSTELRSV